MKKIILLLTIFILTGCGNKKLNIINDEITKINYNDIIIINEDYNQITTNLNQLTFKKINKAVENNNFTITTINNIIKFEIKDNKILYQLDGTNYQSDNKEIIDSINKTLKNLESIYENNSFYTVEKISNYKPTDNDLQIKLDNSDEYIVIKTTQDLYNFKIHKIEKNNETYSDVDLLYEENEIPYNKIISIRYLNIENIRITFETKYNYVISIIPTINGEKIEFIKTFTQK